MAKSLKAAWSRNAQGNRANAKVTLALILNSLEGYMSSGDWTNIAWGLSYMQGADRKRIKDIVEAAAGLKFREDAKQPTGFKKIGKDAGASNRMALLAQYVEAGHGFRDVALENDDDIPALLEGKGEKAAYDYDKFEKAIRAQIVKGKKEELSTVRMMEIMHKIMKEEF